MLFHALADLLVVLHLGFILFVVLGGLLTLRWRWVVWLHLPAALWGAVVEFTGWICPLTPLEIRLRQAVGAPPYATSFVEHYLVPIVYPAALTAELQIVLGCVVVGINGVIYAVLWRRQSARGNPSKFPTCGGGGTARPGDGTRT
jgi:hypothetical protein